MADPSHMSFLMDPMGFYFHQCHPNSPEIRSFHKARITLPKTNVAPEKWMIGILVSFWDGLFSGAMLVLGSVGDNGWFIFLFNEALISSGLMALEGCPINLTQVRMRHIRRRCM